MRGPNKWLAAERWPETTSLTRDLISASGQCSTWRLLLSSTAPNPAEPAWRSGWTPQSKWYKNSKKHKHILWRGMKTFRGRCRDTKDLEKRGFSIACVAAIRPCVMSSSRIKHVWTGCSWLGSGGICCPECFYQCSTHLVCKSNLQNFRPRFPAPKQTPAYPRLRSKRKLRFRQK